MAYTKVGRAEDVPTGAVRVYDVRGREVALCNVDGDLYAIDNVCTHDGGSLDQGEVMGYEVECPRHGARFDVRSGEVTTASRDVTLDDITTVTGEFIGILEGTLVASASTLSKALDAVIEAAGQKCHGRFGSLEAGGVGIAFLHGDDERRFREALDGGEWDMILYGHTHVARQSRVGRTLVLNPGAIYRANPRSIAVVELPALEATMVPLA